MAFTKTEKSGLCLFIIGTAIQTETFIVNSAIWSMVALACMLIGIYWFIFKTEKVVREDDKRYVKKTAASVRALSDVQ